MSELLTQWLSLAPILWYPKLEYMGLIFRKCCVPFLQMLVLKHISKICTISSGSVNALEFLTVMHFCHLSCFHTVILSKFVFRWHSAWQKHKENWDISLLIYEWHIWVCKCLILIHSCWITLKRMKFYIWKWKKQGRHNSFMHITDLFLSAVYQENCCCI